MRASTFTVLLIFALTLVLAGTVFLPHIILGAIDALGGRENCQGGGCTAIAALVRGLVRPVLIGAGTLLLIGVLAGRLRRLSGLGLLVIGPFVLAGLNLFMTWLMAQVFGPPMSFTGVALAMPMLPLESICAIAVLLLLCFPIERAPGFSGSLLAIRWPGRFPAGRAFAVACVLALLRWPLSMAAFAIFGFEKLREFDPIHDVFFSGPRLELGGLVPAIFASYIGIAASAMLLLMMGGLFLGGDRARPIKAEADPTPVPVMRSPRASPSFGKKAGLSPR